MVQRLGDAQHRYLEQGGTVTGWIAYLIERCAPVLAADLGIAISDAEGEARALVSASHDPLASALELATLAEARASGLFGEEQPR